MEDYIHPSDQADEFEGRPKAKKRRKKAKLPNASGSDASHQHMEQRATCCSLPAAPESASPPDHAEDGATSALANSTHPLFAPD